MFCQRASEFFLLALCVCVWGGGGGGQVQYLSCREKITDPPPINKWPVPITKSPKGHYVAYLFLRYFLLLDVVVLFHLLAIADKIYGNHCAPWSVEIVIRYAFP